MPDRSRSSTDRIAARTVPHGGLFGPRYFLHLIGPPSLALAAMSTAAPALPRLRAALAPFCHQIVARSFCVDGRPFGLCARCTGIYLGIAATWLGLGMLARRPRLLAAAEAPAYALAVVSAALWALGIEVDNALRFAFGLALGAAGAFALWRARAAMLAGFGSRPAGAALSFLPISRGKSRQ
ncbi:MAG: DUF2085 domain-containing protein [Alphaproteobacteria bacterium]|nr:DUF2085 domain-containing protein [Alphaproteobacteria bacterium]